MRLEACELPTIIQGGMGIGVSHWQLARAVSKQGGLGVVSGTALDTVMVRRLQLGDPGGDMRRALAAFPARAVAKRIVARYFVAGGIARDTAFKLLSLPRQYMSRAHLQVLVAANFVEVFLAKEGHSAPVGINYLEKIQLPALPSLYGALLAGVDVVLMGAGIPAAVPGAISRLLQGRRAELRLHVEGNTGSEGFRTRFEYSDAFDLDLLSEALRTRGVYRPLFLPIISSHILARTLSKKARGPIDGFVVESHVAGGHNAPPRRPERFEARPSWGAIDEPDLDAIRKLRLPFWLAGGRASARSLLEARQLGAQGVQVGTAFAYCEESAIPKDVKRRAIVALKEGKRRVYTDFEASPTGYPFKLILDDDRPEELVRLRNRSRVCDLGYLRQSYVDDEGKIGYRCPGEPRDAFVKKGGTLQATRNKLCLCNGLLATVGLGQRRGNTPELPVYTAGDHLEEVLRFVRPGRDYYTVSDVLSELQRGRGPVCAFGDDE